MSGTIVVAEGSRTVRRMVEIALDRHPFTIEFASTADAALATVREKAPVVALVDAGLPGDGYEVAAQIKATNTAKVILLVGRNHQFDAARARQAGVDGHLTKPFLTQQLVEHVFNALGESVPDADLFRTTANIPLARHSREESVPAAAPAPPAPAPAAPQAPPEVAPAPPPPPVVAPAPASQVANPFEGVESPFDVNAPTRQYEKPAASASAPPPHVDDATMLSESPRMASEPPPLVSSEPPVPAPPAPSEPPAFEVPDPEPPELSAFDAAEPASFAEPEPPAPVVEAVAQVTAAVGDDLSAALQGASREVVERIAWEVIPPLAEAILKEEIARVVRERMAQQ